MNANVSDEQEKQLNASTDMKISLLYREIELFYKTF